MSAFTSVLTLMFVAVSMIADAAAQENPMQFLSRANAKTARAFR
jgi:hypothetical protein